MNARAIFICKTCLGFSTLELELRAQTCNFPGVWYLDSTSFNPKLKDIKSSTNPQVHYSLNKCKSDHARSVISRGEMI